MYIYKKNGRYRFQLRNHLRKTKDFAGFASKAATMAEAERVRERFVRIKNGTLAPAELLREEAERLPLSRHLDEWHRNMLATGATPAYAKLQHGRAVRTFDACGFKSISELDPVKVQGVIAEGIAGGGSQQTGAHYAQAVRQFSRWIYLNDRCREDRLKRVRKPKVVTLKRDRTAFAWADVVKMIQHVESSPNTQGGCFKMRRRDRGMLYRVAILTGLRRGALKSLTPESFNLTPSAATVSVLPGYSKNRRPLCLPIPDDLTELLRDYLKSKRQRKPLWRVPSHTAAMIRADFRNAGIEFPDDGRARDFHSLRHAYVSTLIRNGVDVKTVADLASHCSVILTQRYSHSTPDHQRRAVDALPAMVSAVQAETS